MKRICAALICICCSAVMARQGVVKTTDGQTYEGDVTEKADSVTVSVRGIETSVPHEKLANISYTDDADYVKQFNERLGKLDKKDVAGRIKLAREAFDNHHYDLSRDAAEEALQIDRNSTEAADLLNTVQSHIRLEHMRGNGGNPPPATQIAAMPGAATNPVQRPGDRKLLSANDVNTIRQFEMTEDEANLRIRFDHDVQRRFAGQQNLKASDFIAQKPIVQAFQILEQGTPDMREDVRILTEPAALMEWRQKIEPLVIQNCATSNCHGGMSPVGGLQLVNPPENDAAHLTNFYMLQSYVKKNKSGGVFSGGDEKMINRTQPAKSLLVQFAMPQSISEYDHPDVANFRPMLKNQADPRYRQLVDWIGQSLVAVEPNYGINFKLPGAAATPPTTQATTQPTTRRGT